MGRAAAGLTGNTCSVHGWPSMKDRHRDREPPTGLAWTLMLALQEIAKHRNLRGAQVDYRRNEKGEHVVALIFPPQPRA